MKPIELLEHRISGLSEYAKYYHIAKSCTGTELHLMYKDEDGYNSNGNIQIDLDDFTIDLGTNHGKLTDKYFVNKVRFVNDLTNDKFVTKEDGIVIDPFNLFRKYLMEYKSSYSF